MQRHEFDLFSAFAGMAFLAIAAGYALTHTTDVRLHWLIVVPAFLLVVGAGVTAVAVRRIVVGDPPIGPAVDVTGDVTDPT
jgi:hypothetical protein